MTKTHLKLKFKQLQPFVHKKFQEAMLCGFVFAVLSPAYLQVSMPRHGEITLNKMRPIDVPMESVKPLNLKMARRLASFLKLGVIGLVVATLLVGPGL